MSEVDGSSRKHIIEEKVPRIQYPAQKNEGINICLLVPMCQVRSAVDAAVLKRLTH